MSSSVAAQVPPALRLAFVVDESVVVGRGGGVFSGSTDSWGSCAARRRTGTAGPARTWTPRRAPGASSTGSWGSWTTWGRPGNRARCTATRAVGDGCTRTGDAGSRRRPVTRGRTGRRRRSDGRRWRPRRRSDGRRPVARTRPAARCRSADSWDTAPGSGRTGTARPSTPPWLGPRELRRPADRERRRFGLGRCILYRYTVVLVFFPYSIFFSFA